MPKQNEAIKKIAKKIQNSDITNIFFESAKRIGKTISIFSEALSQDAQLVICREMTKEYESIYRGNIREISDLFKNNEIKLLGEFVIFVYPHSYLKTSLNLNEDFCLQFLKYLSPADASKLIAKITSFSKQEVYKFF